MLLWKPWLDAMKFGFEVQSVVTLRLPRLRLEGQRTMPSSRKW
jgi:hypothetical protein